MRLAPPVKRTEVLKISKKVLNSIKGTSLAKCMWSTAGIRPTLSSEGDSALDMVNSPRVSITY